MHWVRAQCVTVKLVRTSEVVGESDIVARQMILTAKFAVQADWTATTQAVGTLLAVLVGIVGFIFVWEQIRNLRLELQCEANGKIYAEHTEIMKIFVDKPHLRQYFFENAEIEQGSTDYDAVHAIAHMVCCYFEHVLLQLDNVPEFVRQGWVDYARFIYHLSPATRACFVDYRRFNVYVQEMDEMLQGHGTFTIPARQRRRRAAPAMIFPTRLDGATAPEVAGTAALRKTSAQ